MIPLADLCGGALGSRYGLHTAIWVGAIGASLSIAPLLFSPMHTVRRVEDAEALVHRLNEQFLGPSAG